MAQTTARVLNKLLRGELSAVETYQQALDKLDDTKGAPDLRRIREEHRHAVDTLNQQVRQHGGQPDQSSGTWGMFARTIEGAAKVFGTGATLKALKEGEEYGIKKYESALLDQDVPADCQELIVADLLPQTRSHLPVLDRLMAGLVERITPREAKQHLSGDPSALLVCAYDSPEKFRQYHLAGALSLDAFDSMADSIPKGREIIFYCA